MKAFLSLILFISSIAAHAQTIYNPIRGYWDKAGYSGQKSLAGASRDIVDFGADPYGLRSSTTAFNDAVADLGGRPGVIVFPAGRYFFDAPILINRDSIVLRGAGHDSSRLRFDLSGQIRNLITIAGSRGQDSSMLRAPFLRGDSSMIVDRPELFHVGDWVTLRIDDAAYMMSDWAYGTLGQTMQIREIQGNELLLGSKARFNYFLALRPRIHSIQPRSNVGIECLSLERLDATTAQTSNIVYDAAVNCWVSGIESDKTNFAHVEINRSSNIEIRNSWFHDAFAYGGGGQGYGVLLQTGANECLVSGNYFQHLRHSMILQSGANGNVLSYNYSTKPYWTEAGLPDSSAGEIVLHGNYPFMNLAEGNIVQNIVIDDSHGKNGPLNTFFRNRATGFGIFMNFSLPTDSVQFIGNEVTNGATGLYFISGRGHLQFANNYRGTITGTAGRIPDNSLYLSAGARPECSDGLIWPAIGEAGRYNTGSIPVVKRVEAGLPASCACEVVIQPTAITSANRAETWLLAPNPAHDEVRLIGHEAPQQADLYDASGRVVLQIRGLSGNNIPLSTLPAGRYMLRIQTRNATQVLPLTIQR